MDRKKKRYSVPDEAFCATPPYMPDAAYLQGGNRPFYQPTPAPNTVVIHDTPTRSKNACCLGCLAAMCLCCGIQECCTIF